MTFPNRSARSEAKKQLANALNTSTKRVNRLKLCERPLESVIKREKNAENAAKHREKCSEQAESVKNGAVSMKRAAKECGISERQMARHVARALQQKEDD